MLLYRQALVARVQWHPACEVLVLLPLPLLLLAVAVPQLGQYDDADHEDGEPHQISLGWEFHN